MEGMIDLAVASSDQELRGWFADFTDEYRLSFLETLEEVELRLLDEKAPEVLIWDLRSERVSHQEALEVIGKVNPQLPVVVLAWPPRAEPGPRFLQAGNVYIVRQPVTAAVLRALVEFVQAKAAACKKGGADCRLEHVILREHLYGRIESEAIFENLPIAGMVVDEKRMVLSINREARRLTGVSADEAVGKATCRELWRCRIDDDDCPLVKEPLSNRPRKEEVAACPRGVDRTLLERVSTLRDPITGETETVILSAVRG